MAEPLYRANVLVCGSTGCTASGAQKVREALEAEIVVQPLRRLPSDPGHGEKQGHRIRLAPHPLKHGEAAGENEVTDRASEALPDVRQGLQRLQTAMLEHLTDRMLQLAQGPGGSAVGADTKPVGPLLLEDLGHLVEA